MINSVTVTNPLGESIVLSLMSPEQSGFIILNLDGLGPSKATINSTEMLGNDGSVFNSARVNSRNITFTLLFHDGISTSIEDLRRKSYKYFPLAEKVRLKFETTGRTCIIDAHVESNEPNIFSKKENTTVSLICPDPFFYADAITTTTFSGAQSLFKFPFSNESLSEKLIDFGSLLINSEQTVFYEGNSKVGVTIYVHALGPVEDLTIYSLRTNQIMAINTDRLASMTGSGFGNGDDIIITTQKGNKTITLIRNGILTNILNCLDKDADWFYLLRGDNLFTYTATSGLANLQFKVEHRTVYEGL